MLKTTRTHEDLATNTGKEVKISTHSQWPEHFILQSLVTTQTSSQTDLFEYTSVFCILGFKAEIHLFWTFTVLCFQQRGQRVICIDVYFIKKQNHHIFSDMRLAVTRNSWSVHLDHRCIGKYFPSYWIYFHMWLRASMDLRISDLMCFLLTCSLFTSDLFHIRGEKKSELFCLNHVM